MLINQRLKKKIGFFIRHIIDTTSISAVLNIVKADTEFKRVWDDTFIFFPDFRGHYTDSVDSKEIGHRIRLLVVAETVFVKDEIDNIIKADGQCSYADIGDSDGSVRLLLNKYFPDNRLDSIGMNLQKSAVERIKNKGLNAICADALSLRNEGISCDVVSAFETLEHLPDPIGFLRGLRSVVNCKLVISIPFVRNSRVGLAYLSNAWQKGKRPTIENTHIFELSKRDWKKIFLHSGWAIDKERKLMMFLSNKLSRLVLQPYWRYMSFEGFWFISLYKDDKYTSQYAIE